MSTESQPRIAVPATEAEADSIIDGINTILGMESFKMTKEARRDLEIRVLMVEAAATALRDDEGGVEVIYCE